nr:PREDICTED: uncharacterized protein LOC103981768 [Musa acuminata subsp. malaccensis]
MVVTVNMYIKIPASQLLKIVILEKNMRTLYLMDLSWPDAWVAAGTEFGQMYPQLNRGRIVNLGSNMKCGVSEQYWMTQNGVKIEQPNQSCGSHAGLCRC